MLKKYLTKIIEFYQRAISPLLGRHCRFEPTCSQYSALAIEKYGAVKGMALSVWRVLRCNPLSRGGIDHP